MCPAASQAPGNAAPATMPHRPGDAALGASLYELGGCRLHPSSSSAASFSSSSSAAAAAAAPTTALPPPQAEAPGDPARPGAGGAGTGAPADPKAEQQQQLRRKINSRERRRLRALNAATDALRQVLLPRRAARGQGAGRGLSRAATLLLAGALRGLRRALGEGAGGPRAPRLLPAGLPLPAAPAPPLPAAPPAALRPAKRLALALEEPPGGRFALPVGGGGGGSGGGSGGGPGLCPCAGCRFPHLVPAGVGLAALHAPFFSP